MAALTNSPGVDCPALPGVGIVPTPEVGPDVPPAAGVELAPAELDPELPATSEPQALTNSAPVKAISDGAISDGDLMRVRRGRGLAGSARPAFRRPPPFRPPRTAARPLLQLLLAHGALRSTGCSVWC